MLNVTKLLIGAEADEPARPPRHRSGAMAGIARKPNIVWSITQRCNLQCIHCPSDSGSGHFKGELSLRECINVIDDLSDFKVGGVHLTGGEPMLHPHFFDLVGYATARGLIVSVSTNGTRLTSTAALKLKDLGIEYVELSVNGIGPCHDEECGRPGAFRKVVEALRHCRGAGVKVGLSLPLSRLSMSQIGDILRFIDEEDIPRISFHHLSYSGRGAQLQRLTSTEIRTCLRLISDAVLRWHREGNTREVLTVDQPADGPFFWLNSKRKNPKQAREIWRQLNWNGSGHHLPEIACPHIDSQGNVHPNEFWPSLTLGNIRMKPFSRIWKSGIKEPPISELKDRLPRLTGRCGSCRFRDVCGGGFRVRALHVHGDLWAEDPDCHLRDYEIASQDEAAIAPVSGRIPADS